MMTLVRSYSLLRRWKSNAPPEALNGRYPCADECGIVRVRIVLEDVVRSADWEAING